MVVNLENLIAEELASREIGPVMKGVVDLILEVMSHMDSGDNADGKLVEQILRPQVRRAVDKVLGPKWNRGEVAEEETALLSDVGGVAEMQMASLLDTVEVAAGAVDKRLMATFGHTRRLVGPTSGLVLQKGLRHRITGGGVLKKGIERY